MESLHPIMYSFLFWFFCLVFRHVSFSLVIYRFLFFFFFFNFYKIKKCLSFPHTLFPSPSLMSSGVSFFSAPVALSLALLSLSFSDALISSGVKENCLLAPKVKSTKSNLCFSPDYPIALSIDDVNKPWRHPAAGRETCLFHVAFRPELIALASIKSSKDWTVGLGFSLRLFTLSGKRKNCICVRVKEASIHTMFAYLF